jgi:hypothetical protein
MFATRGREDEKWSRRWEMRRNCREMDGVVAYNDGCWMGPYISLPIHCIYNG